MPQFPVKDIQPNPFRHINRYPIRREKISALRESLRTTGFWGNVVARRRDGKAEIAYGHHRLVALKEEFGPRHKVDLIVMKLSDEAMLQMMARENMEEWGTSAAVEHETIRAVVEAFAEGKVDLPAHAPAANKSQLRFAPSFVPGDDTKGQQNKSYTAQSVAQFLGWLEPKGNPQDKVLAGLAALQYIEEDLLAEKDFEGLTTKQAEAVIDEARRARSRREEAARVHRQQAERAAREAVEAERRREVAAHAQKDREEVAKRARNEAQRRRAQEEARRHAEEGKRQEGVRRLAERRRESETRKELKVREEAKKQATKVGRGVSEQLRAGKIGYKQAPTAATKISGTRAGPPPYIDDFARRLATDLNVLLDLDRDPRSDRLRLLIQFKDNIRTSVRADLVRTLEQLATRATAFARQLEGGPRVNPERRGLPGRR